MSGIHHIALRVKDCARSARFYEQAFGLREIRRVDSGDGLRAIWLGAGETVLMLEHSLRGSGAPAGSGHVLIFRTADLTAAEERLKATGIEVTDRTASTLYVSDPDGHRAGVSTFPFSETCS
jgi:lactoylglutathione lyase